MIRHVDAITSDYALLEIDDDDDDDNKSIKAPPPKKKKTATTLSLKISWCQWYVIQDGVNRGATKYTPTYNMPNKLTSIVILTRLTNFRSIHYGFQ